MGITVLLTRFLQILDCNHTLNPSTYEKDHRGLEKGHLRIPFRLQFPIPPCSQFYAPPSLDMREDDLRATVTYSVRVEVSTASKVRSKLVEKHAILFRPPNHVVLHRPLSIPTTSICAMLAADSLNPGVTPPYEAPYLPQYCPALQVDLTLPSPTVLQLGQPVPMELDITVTEDLMSCLGCIRLRRLHISLTAATSVQSGPASRATESTTTICSINGDFSLISGGKRGTCRIDSNLWRDRGVPEVPISFSSSNVARSYTMNVVVGFSSGKRDNIEVCVFRFFSFMFPLLVRPQTSPLKVLCSNAEF